MINNGTAQDVRRELRNLYGAGMFLKPDTQCLWHCQRCYLKRTAQDLSSTSSDVEAYNTSSCEAQMSFFNKQTSHIWKHLQLGNQLCAETEWLQQSSRSRNIRRQLHSSRRTPSCQTLDKQVSCDRVRPQTWGVHGSHFESVQYMNPNLLH